MKALFDKDRFMPKTIQGKPEKSNGKGSFSLADLYFVGALATAIGVVMVFLLNVVTPLNFSFRGFQADALHAGDRLLYLVVILFVSCGWVFLVMFQLLKPLVRYRQVLQKGEALPEDVMERARRRLLNLPFLFIPASLGVWILIPGVLFMVAHLQGVFDFRSAVIFWVRTAMVGLLTSFIGFYGIEYRLRRKLIPAFFPDGRLTDVKGTASFTISRRIRMLYRIGSLIPLVILIITMILVQWEMNSMEIGAKEFGREMIFFALVLFGVFFVATGVLNRMVSRSISQPLGQISEILRGVQFGDFDRKVQVVSNDEVGYVGDVINEMIDGLVERESMRQSLELAKEVQQNLLPKKDFCSEELSIAGKSVYCDETGGDYFDFFPVGREGNGKIGMAIGDVSGHGIPSALLMTTVRSSLRQRASISDRPGEIVTDVNRQLVMDVENSGQFMTLLFLVIETNTKRLEWVRAGHDPAILYDPQRDVFTELGGAGIALGIDEKRKYRGNERKGVTPGQIVFLSTDGIWELRNPAGQMLGKKPVLDIIRKHADLNVRDLLEKIFQSLEDFSGGSKREDDVTAMVIKIGKC
jgi:sigma-B regulation protein RsbU (phosphoserine phosphatase)